MMEKKYSECKKDRKIGQEQDEIEYATSWHRAFSNLYQRFRWLQSFANINKIAAKTVLFKFANQVLVRKKDAEIYKKLSYFTSQFEISKS